MRSACPLHRFLIIPLLALAALCFPGGAALGQAASYEFDPAFNGNYTIDAFTTGETTGAERHGARSCVCPAAMSSPPASCGSTTIRSSHRAGMSASCATV
jgi:hypothetical protein